MNNYDIEDWCHKHKVNLKGVYAKDKVVPIDANQAMVINLDDSDGPGSHWTCVISNKTNCFYYDSFGNPPSKKVIKVLNKFNIYSSDEINQDFKSVICGYYVLCAIKYIHLKGYSFQKFMDMLNDYSQDNELKIIELLKD